MGTLPFTTVFNAKGLEIFGKYKFQKFSVLTGYNLYVPDLKSTNEIPSQYSLDPGFKKNDIIIGLSYSPLDLLKFTVNRDFLWEKHQPGKERKVFSLRS